MPSQTETSLAKHATGPVCACHAPGLLWISCAGHVCSTFSDNPCCQKGRKRQQKRSVDLTPPLLGDANAHRPALAYGNLPCSCCAARAPCVTGGVGADGIYKAEWALEQGYTERACEEPATSEQTGEPWSRNTCHTPRSFRNRRFATRPTLRGAVTMSGLPLTLGSHEGAPHFLWFSTSRGEQVPLYMSPGPARCTDVTPSPCRKPIHARCIDVKVSRACSWRGSRRG